MDEKLTFTVSEEEDVSIIAFTGNLDTNTSEGALDMLNDLIDSGKTSLLVDFTELNFISSAGLRILLATARL